MDSRLFSRPLAPAIFGVHLDYATFLGSDLSNANAAYGYVEHKKPRWTQLAREYQDVGALERFGIDPTKPVPLGVTVTADPYGYPIDGYTTGYTTKLPPPADMVAAQRTPRSFNVPAIVQSGNGMETIGTPPVPPDEQSTGPGKEPVEDTSRWGYGDKSGMKSTAELAALARDMQNLVNRAGVDPATAAQALLTLRARNRIDRNQVVAPAAGDQVVPDVQMPQAQPEAEDQQVPGAFPE
jgi:hypothetical protein